MLTHEFGHVLNYGHDVLGDSLGVGERNMPFEDEADEADTSTFAMTLEDLLLY